MHLFYLPPIVAQSIEEVCEGAVLSFPLPPFAAFDANQDATLDEGEASECGTLGTLFTRLDLDANQLLDPVEYEAFPALWTQHARTFDEIE